MGSTERGRFLMRLRLAGCSRAYNVGREGEADVPGLRTLPDGEGGFMGVGRPRWECWRWTMIQRHLLCRPFRLSGRRARGLPPVWLASLAWLGGSPGSAGQPGQASGLAPGYRATQVIRAMRERGASPALNHQCRVDVEVVHHHSQYLVRLYTLISLPSSSSHSPNPINLSTMRLPTKSLLALLPLLSSVLAASDVVDLTGDNFQNEVAGEELALVEFFAPCEL